MENNPAPPPSDGLEIHLMDYLRVVLSRLHIAITVFLGVVILATVWSMTRKPRYTAKASVEMLRTKTKVIDSGEIYEEGSDIAYDREFIPTQIKLLTADPILKAVYELPSVKSEPAMKAAVSKTKALRGMFRVTQVRNSRILEVSCEREDPTQAKEMVNKLVDAFMGYKRSLRADVSEVGLDSLRDKLAELEEELRMEDKVLTDFRRERKITNFEDETQLRMDEIKELRETFLRGEPNRISLEAKVDSARKAGNDGEPIESIPFVLENTIIIKLLQTRADLEVELLEKKIDRGENHREVQALRASLVGLNSQITTIGKSVIKALESEQRVAEKESGRLQSKIDETRSRLNQLGDLKTDYDVLNRRREDIAASWRKISNRIQEVELASISGQAEGIKVISLATVPAPSEKSYPNHFRNLFLAGLLGSLLAIGACFFLNYMDTTVKDMDDIREIYGCEILGTLPPAAGELKGVKKLDFLALEKPRSHFAEAFRMIRTNLAFAAQGNEPNHIAVTSAVPSEGKSIVSINLAVSHAQLNKRTLLIDSDMRKPRLHKAFNFDKGYGLSDLLQAPESELPDLVKRAAIPTKRHENLFLVTSGNKVDNPAELLQSEGLERLLRAAEDQFDFIVFDTPPSAQLVDSFIISQKIDGLIVVVKTFSTQLGPSRFLAENLKQSNVRLLGCICNNKEMPRGGRLAYYYGYGKYGYGGYGSGYGYGYGKYYDDSGMFSKLKRKEKRTEEPPPLREESTKA